MLAVDRNDGRRPRGGQFHHQRTGHHQGLLVGQRDALARFQRGPGPAQPRTAHNRRHHDVDFRIGCHLLHAVLSHHQLRLRRQACPAELPRQIGRGRDQPAGSVLLGLLYRLVQPRVGRDRIGRQATGEGRNHLERAATDAAGRAQDGDVGHTVIHGKDDGAGRWRGHCRTVELGGQDRSKPQGKEPLGACGSYNSQNPQSGAPPPVTREPRGTPETYRPRPVDHSDSRSTRSSDTLLETLSIMPPEQPSGRRGSENKSSSYNFFLYAVIFGLAILFVVFYVLQLSTDEIAYKDLLRLIEQSKRRFLGGRHDRGRRSAGGPLQQAAGAEDRQDGDRRAGPSPGDWVHRRATTGRSPFARSRARTRRKSCCWSRHSNRRPSAGPSRGAPASGGPTPRCS